MEASRGALLAAAGLLLACAAALTPGAQAFPFGGSTGAFKLMNQWTYKLKGAHPTAPFYPYIQTNSPDALAGLKSLKFLCGISEIPYPAAEEQYYEKYTFPLMVGQYALFTGKPIVMHLSPAQIAAIFLGRIRNWKQLGKKVRGYSGNGAIQVIGRSDASGTTYLSTKYMRKASPATYPESLNGRGPYKFGSTTLLVKGTAGVVAALKKNPNAIGWVEAAMGYDGKLWEVAVLNGNGRYVKAATASVKALVDKIGFPVNRAYSWSGIPPRLVFQSTDPHAHPVTGFIYALTRQDYIKAAGKLAYPTYANLVKATLLWTMSPAGQASGRMYGYQPLPAQLIPANIVYMKKIVVKGGLPF